MSGVVNRFVIATGFAIMIIGSVFPAVSLTLTTIPQAVLGVIFNLILPKEKENAKRFYLTSRSRNISVLLLKMDSSLYSQIKPVLIFIR